MPAIAVPGTRSPSPNSWINVCLFYVEMETDVNINNDIGVGQ